jgi:hypothetical protein
MTTMTSSRSRRAELERQWKQGLICLSQEELDWVMFGIDAHVPSEFGHYSGPVEIDWEDFKDFEMS